MARTVKHAITHEAARQTATRASSSTR
jgi:hypothetical protein